MDKQVFPTSDSPVLHLDIDGELIVKGSSDLEVSVRSDSPEDLQVDQHEDEFTVKCRSNCSIRVPHGSSLNVLRVSGNTIIKAIDGNISIDRSYGNLTMKGIGTTRINRIDGNLVVKNGEGILEVETVHGNIVAKNLEGFNATGRIDGNLMLADLDGSGSAKCNGNITLRFDPMHDQKYRFEASGNIICRLPEDVSAAVRIESGGSIRVKVGDISVSQRETSYSVNFGDGDAELVLVAGGDVSVIGRAPDWEISEDFDADFGEEFAGMAEELGEQVARQVEAQMEMLERHLNDQLSNLSATIGAVGLSSEAAEQISQRAREASARATARAQEKMQRAQERLRRKMEAIQRKAETKARKTERRMSGERRGWSFDWSSPKPEPVSDPVSEQERMMILKMLEEKKISLDQAEKLLSALEGDSE
ncbi:MAG: hypothetical protein EHM41_09045 [Chloroflexi bacterium]|nr:MAG: hypothetical protein EHM41_09045 [Chloroflexota bacterium]